VAPRFLDSQVQDVSEPREGSYWVTRDYTETQIKIITSRAVAERTVEKLGLQNDAAFLGVDRIPDPSVRASVMQKIDAPGSS
jgi:uncharacterized protein involved in exopolysaccharide biosynthesis